MTGMKEGAGEDPFTDADESADAEPPDHSAGADPSGSSTDTTGRSESRPQQPTDIPYKFRRDSVRDGRNRVPLFLQGDTKSAERDALRELEARFDDDVSLTDLREALLKTGLQHLDDVQEQLEEWGYGMTFDG